MDDAPTGRTTVQLRRYRVADGELDAFVHWWRQWMPRMRSAYGFTIEFAYALPATSEFVWAVSAPGGIGEFEEREARYLASELRAHAFDGIPERLVGRTIGYVDDVAGRSA
ncbi:MAG: hypothetical protein ACTHMF_14585 [Leifsonia sp.]|uniref:hypothetical protein n=1 Tax=Leifsonia sp. TaxID=1870902 RepID=UPI003F8232AF